MSIRDMFRRQRTPQGLEELLGMISNGSKPAKPGKIKITQVEFGADFVTQLVETGLEQFGILDAIKKSAEEQRQIAQSQVDEAMERLHQERREMRAKELRKSTIQVEVSEFITGQIYPFQMTHQALAEYTGRYREQFEYIPDNVVSAVKQYSNGSVHNCGDPECTPDMIHQTLRRYDEVKRLAEVLMANVADEEYRRWAESDEDNPVEDMDKMMAETVTEPMAEQAAD